MKNLISFTQLTDLKIPVSLRPRQSCLIVVTGLGLLSGSLVSQAACPTSCVNGNTSLGDGALMSLTTGMEETAVGFDALFSTTSGNRNTALGNNTLLFNTTGSFNTAIGSETLNANTTGSSNTAVGTSTLIGNTTGNSNTAIGVSALVANMTGSFNTATGAEALSSAAAASFNTATGYQALSNDQGGNSNTSFGYQALYSNISGSSNTALGASALKNTSGTNNIGLGTSAGVNLTTGSNNIDIGALGAAGDSNTMRIGKFGAQTKTYIAGVNGSVVAGGVTVIVDSLGHFGTTTSSARYKEAIKPMKDASEAILALKPVSFRYKKELDPDAILQFGLVAEDVAKVDPDLVARDAQGKPYTVRYEAVNAMLLNEFLKAHKKLEDQAKTAEVQAQEISELRAALKQQADQMQELGARLAAKGL